MSNEEDSNNSLYQENLEIMHLTKPNQSGKWISKLEIRLATCETFS